uniref:Dienelactone hydrolase domain-containing protein n=1 Tax=Leersia perrieri TaxID=77586 RepID=A0A0D9WG89_9ORYZ
MASPQCCANPPTLNPAGGEGKVVDSFGGIKSYVAGAAESKAAVILVSDVFGFEAPNLRKIADKVASSGYFVVVPDFLHGDPLVLESTEKPFPVWIKEHGPDKAFEEAKPVIAALKEKGASTVGAVGYCWGAKVVAELAKAHEIQAAVMCHPSFVTVDDIKEVKCPIAILGAEIDRMSPPEVVKQFEQVLSSKSGRRSAHATHSVDLHAHVRILLVTRPPPRSEPCTPVRTGLQLIQRLACVARFSRQQLPRPRLLLRNNLHGALVTLSRFSLGLSTDGPELEVAAALHDTLVPEGNGMASPQCCANPPALNPAGGEGKVVDSFGGIKAYISGADDSKAAVILASDVYGFEAPNLRKIADKVASSGYFVVVPDFIHGDPFVPANTERPIQVWIKEHGPDKGFEEAKPVIAALKEKGVSSIGAAGYCWGAKVVVELAKAHEIQAAVMCHPSFVTVDDIKEVKCPIAILAAEVDHMSPVELIKQFEQVLSSMPEVDHLVKIFPGVEHGWTVRYKSDDANAVKRLGSPGRHD